MAAGNAMIFKHAELT
ncbi:MAG: hypothetical protein R6U99_09465, partial [Nioella sp.]